MDKSDALEAAKTVKLAGLKVSGKCPGLTACSKAELQAFLRQMQTEPKYGAVAPTGEAFVDFRQDEEALLVFGILAGTYGACPHSEDPRSNEILHKWMGKKGIELKGCEFVCPDEEDGLLIHRRKGALRQLLAPGQFETGYRGFFLTNGDVNYIGGKKAFQFTPARPSSCPKGPHHYCIAVVRKVAVTRQP